MKKKYYRQKLVDKSSPLLWGALTTLEIAVLAYAAVPPDRAQLGARLALLAAARGITEPAVTVEKVPPCDWLAATYHAFPPLHIGRYFIHGSHYRGPAPQGMIGLQIDAATAFGSGEHPSTAGCLLALDRLARRLRPRRALDMGCGSGILALAMAKRWRVPVCAADSDPEAVRVTAGNIRSNGVERLVRTAVSNGFRAPAVHAGAPYDVITANILARPLAYMAKDMALHLAGGGFAVLSGLMAHQEPQARTAYRAQGMAVAGRVPIRNWTTLILRKDAPPRR